MGVNFQSCWCGEGMAIVIYSYGGDCAHILVLSEPRVRHEFKEGGVK